MAFEVILKKNIKIKKKNLVVSYGEMEFYWRGPQSHANCRMETHDGGFPWLEMYTRAAQPSLKDLQTVLTMPVPVTSRRTLRASVSVKVCLLHRSHVKISV